MHRPEVERRERVRRDPERPFEKAADLDATSRGTSALNPIWKPRSPIVHAIPARYRQRARSPRGRSWMRSPSPFQSPLAPPSASAATTAAAAPSAKASSRAGWRRSFDLEMERAELDAHDQHDGLRITATNRVGQTEARHAGVTPLETDEGARHLRRETSAATRSTSSPGA